MSPPIPKTVKTALGLLGGAALTSACACLNYAIDTNAEETGDTGEDTGEAGEEKAQASESVIERGVLPDDIATILRDRKG